MTIQRLVVERLIVGQMAANCYLVFDEKTKEAIIIDPGEDAQYIVDKIQRLELQPTMIVATHGHFDHILAGFEVEKAFNIPFVISEADRFLVERMHETAKHFIGKTVVEPPPEITRTLAAGEELVIGNHMLQVLATPGHTPGSICLFDSEGHRVFTGDTLFAEGGVGRTDFSYAKPLQLSESLASLFTLPPDTEILPGHGETSTIGEEKSYHTSH